MPTTSCGPLVDRPLGVLADEGDVLGPEPGLLGQLAPRRRLGQLAGLQPALGQLPLAGEVDPLERQHLARRHGRTTITTPARK